MNMSLIRLTISIDEKQNQKLKELSQDQDQSLSHIIRTAIDAFITNDEDVHTNYEDTQNTNFEDKYVEHLEKTNNQLSVELEQKNLLIQNLTNGKIVLKEKNDSSIGFFQKVRNLLLPSG